MPMANTTSNCAPANGNLITSAWKIVRWGWPPMFARLASTAAERSTATTRAFVVEQHLGEPSSAAPNLEHQPTTNRGPAIRRASG